MVIEFLTAILVVVTAIYAFLTYRMAESSRATVEEMRNQSEAIMRPYITISPFIRPHTPFIYLRIANIGRSAALNLKLSIDKDYFQFGELQDEKNLKNMTVFTTPTDSFAPSSELIFALAQGWVIFDESSNSAKCPTQFTITANYQFQNKIVEEKHNIDLRSYKGSEGEKNPLVEELEKIRKIMEKKKV